MKSFFKYLFATLVGLSIFFIGGMFIFVAIIGSQEKPTKITENSLLTIEINKPIQELTPDDPFQGLSEAIGGVPSPANLHDMIKALKYAAKDEKIKGVYIKGGSPMSSPALLQELREALINFKAESGKFIIAYAEMYSESGYYVASVADEIILNPRGAMDMSGLASEITFFKGTLDKLGVEVQIFRVGEFKSAVEPFFRKNMSDASRAQTESFLNSIYNSMISQISDSRGIPAEKLRSISDEMEVRRAEDALRLNLITKLGYYDEVLDMMREKLDLEEDKDIPSVNTKKYLKSIDKQDYSRNRIAVIVAEGNIVSGGGELGSIGSDKYAKEIRKARTNDKVKAIVLRINSPGGSALASDVMWREVMLASQVKPVIASMSGVAASGGYYMAMGCDTIVAHPTTITGSIGIFGLIPNMQKFFDDKLGVTFDVAKTGKYSDMMTISRPLNAAEKAIVQEMIEEGYEDFTKKAADGRAMSHEELLKVASGRVWSGSEALDNKLVDVLGGLDVAVEIAAKKADVADDYMVKFYPEEKPFFQKIMEELGATAQAGIARIKYGELQPFARELKKIEEYKGIQARMPFEIDFK